MIYPYLEIDSVERHALGRLIDGPTLQERKVLIPVDRAGDDGIPLGLGQPVQMHLLVEKVHHLLLLEAEGQITHVHPAGLSRHTGPDHGHGGLGRVRHQGGGDLARLLHALVL